MKKLADYFSSKRQATPVVVPVASNKPKEGTHSAVGAAKSTLEDFPVFSEKEEQEIRSVLNIRKRDVDTRSVIIQTLKSFKELPIVANEAEGKKVAVIKPKDDDDDEDGEEDYATFRVNLAKRGLKASEEEDDCIYDTFKVNKGGNNDDDDDGIYDTFQPGGGGDEADFLPVFRVPDDWELKILALEKGEWVDGMENDNAFRRWKKDRPRLRSSVFAQPLRQSVSAARKSGVLQPLLAKNDKKQEAPRGSDAKGTSTAASKQPPKSKPVAITNQSTSKKPEPLMPTTPSPSQVPQASTTSPRRPSFTEPPTQFVLPSSVKKAGSAITKPVAPTTPSPSTSPNFTAAKSTQTKGQSGSKIQIGAGGNSQSPARGKWPPEHSSSSSSSSSSLSSSSSSSSPAPQPTVGFPNKKPPIPGPNPVAAKAKAKLEDLRFTPVKY